MADTDKDELVRAMLIHVPFDGWSDAAITAAAQECGISDDDARTLLPGGPIDAIDHFTHLADQDMAVALDQLDPRPTGITSIIREAILCRLDGAAPHREAVATALRILARPPHAPLAAKTLYRTVDRIWRLTGDGAVDFSFYTKRATLAGVYSATLLYWVANPSADRQRMETFLDQRLREVALIPKITAPARKAAAMGLKMAGRMFSRMPMRHSS
ncbi:COQ9 family protein [Alphaproteobacteria bacterium LSUCC0684]